MLNIFVLDYLNNLEYIEIYQWQFENRILYVKHDLNDFQVFDKILDCLVLREHFLAKHDLTVVKYILIKHRA
jgi:hypothetical protein